MTPPPPAIPLTRNSHVTAVAWALRCLNCTGPDESDEALAAAAWVHLRDCRTCGDGGSAQWDVTRGLQAMLDERGVRLATYEAYRRGPDDVELATIRGIEGSLANGFPVIATFCRERTAVIPAVAAQRRQNAFSVAVVGVWRSPEGDMLIARDGLLPGVEPPTCDFRRGGDSVEPTRPTILYEVGTSSYPWDTGNANVVLTFIVPREDETARSKTGSDEPMREAVR